jgi:ferric-dicitrate binding protein FerR (iron transport regulator)
MVQDFKELLRKYKERACTMEELARFRSFFTQRKDESLIKNTFHKELESFVPSRKESSGLDSKRIFEKIQLKINESPPQVVLSPINGKHTPVFLQILKIATVVIPVFLLGGILSYFIFTSRLQPEKVTFTEVRSPFGARSEVVLPDGSTVWLNAGSRIKYRSDFNKDNREIQLSGEGYFKVTPNEELFFNVITGDLSIQVLGTEFNVKSYDDESIIETTLVEGKIAIQQGRKHKGSIYLKPNQKAVYVKNNNLLTVKDLKVVREAKPEALQLKKGIIYIAEKVDPEPIIAWKENRMILKGEELGNLVIKLQRKFDVMFIFGSNTLNKFRFTGTIENETLTQVLDVIKLSAPIEYKLQGRTVLIIENKKMSEKFLNHLKKK